MLLQIIVNGSVLELEDWLKTFSNPKQRELLNAPWTTECEFISDMTIEPIPLHLAAYLLSPSCMDRLLRHGASPNLIDRKGNTPLSILFQRLQMTRDFEKVFECIQVLMCYKSFIDEAIIDSFVYSSVNYLANGKITYYTLNNQILKILFYHFIHQIFKQAICDENFSVIDSCLSNEHIITHPELSNIVFCEDIHLDLNAIPDLPFIVASRNSPFLIQKLHDYGIHWFIKDKFGQNIFHYAANANRKDNIQILTLLLQTEAYSLLCATDDNGWTPLKIAAEQGFNMTLSMIDRCLCMALQSPKPPTTLLFTDNKSLDQKILHLNGDRLTL